MLFTAARVVYHLYGFDRSIIGPIRRYSIVGSERETRWGG
jgi:hypothetical protein